MHACTGQTMRPLLNREERHSIFLLHLIHLLRFSLRAVCLSRILPLPQLRGWMCLCFRSLLRGYTHPSVCRCYCSLFTLCVCECGWLTVLNSEWQKMLHMQQTKHDEWKWRKGTRHLITGRVFWKLQAHMLSQLLFCMFKTNSWVAFWF